MSIDYDNIINIINENKEYINNSVIFVPYASESNLQLDSDFFENIVSVLTNTVIFGKERISESYFVQPIPQDLITKSVCVLFIESYNKYSIKDFSEWFEEFYKNPNFNFESYKILDSTSFKLEIKNPNYNANLRGSSERHIEERESKSLVNMNEYKSSFFRIIERDWPHLLEGEEFLYNLNKVF